MGGGIAQRIETGIDAGAAALLAGALLFGASNLGLPLAAAAPIAAAGYFFCFRLLRSIDPTHAGSRLADFALGTFQPEPPELLLDDVLAEVGEDSRVVRLFDAGRTSRAARADASQELYDALAELRRSLH